MSKDNIDHTIPVDWPGLLAWSMKYHDDTRTSEAVQAMSAADMEFLTSAMDAVIMDQTQRLKTLIEVLRLPEDGARLHELVTRHKNALRALDDKKNLLSVLDVRQAKAARADEPADDTIAVPADAAPATAEQLVALEARVAREKAEALEEAEEICWKVDRANGFVALKGLGPLEACLKSAHAPVRALAAKLVATLVQNNVKAQTAVCETNILQSLLALLAFEDETAVAKQFALKWITKFFTIDLSPVLAPRTLEGYQVVRAALYALSCLLSNHTQAQALFLSNSGLPHLFRLLAAAPHAAELPPASSAGSDSDESARVRNCAVVMRRRAAALLAELAGSDVKLGRSTAENIQRFCVRQAAERAGKDADAAAVTDADTLAAVSASADAEARALAQVTTALVEVESTEDAANAAEPGAGAKAAHAAWGGGYQEGSDASGSVRVGVVVAEVALLTVTAADWAPLAAAGDRETLKELRRAARLADGGRYDAFARGIAGELFHGDAAAGEDEEEHSA